MINGELVEHVIETFRTGTVDGRENLIVNASFQVKGQTRTTGEHFESEQSNNFRSW